MTRVACVRARVYARGRALWRAQDGDARTHEGGGGVEIKVAASETVSLDALLLAAVLRAPCSPQIRQLREREREHAKE